MSRALLSRSVVGRFALGAFLLLALASVPVSTQVPGQNVNMISVDKYQQKQNEIDLTISPRNPCHIVGAANDYRTVDNKGLNTDGEIGDSWVGVYVSTDCGETWLNYIMPGYGQGYTTAADPIARFGPGGGLYISHIQFNRGTNWGRVAVARYFDFNNFEGVPLPATPAEDQSDLDASPVGYLGTTEVARGSAGQFLDKPAIAVVPGTGAACAVAGGATIPATDVFVSWTEFLSKSDVVLRTKVYFARFTNCGQTLAAPPTKLSEAYPVNQGTVIAVNPANPSLVYVAWRQVATDKTVDAIIFVKSTDGGRTFTKPAPVAPFDGVTTANLGYAYKPFDQSTTNTTFRTLGYPTMVLDENGRAYLAVAARVGPLTEGNWPTNDPDAGPPLPAPLPEARILMTSTLDGLAWKQPIQVDGGPVEPAGHQFMPALAYAGGRLNLTWYDLRYDVSAAFKAFVDEKDAFPVNTRHTLDVRGAQAAVGWPTSFVVYGVSDIGDEKKKVSLYHAQNGTDPGTQLNFNRANLKLYAGGTKPFLGDYIGTAGLQYVPDGSGWRFNDAAAALNNAVLRTFHTAWTDNRDAVVGRAGESGGANPDLDYIAPGTVTGDCSAIESTEYAKRNSRNANIYTSRITPGLFLSALGNTKPGNIERAFAIQVENGTGFDMDVHLSIAADQPASFMQPATSGERSDDITIPRFSSTARTVYVAAAGTGSPRIDVVALQTNPAAGEQPLRAAIVLNGDPVSQLVQPSNGSDDVASKDTHNPRVENPRVENPRVENSSVKNPRVENPRVENPRVENPRVENTSVETPRVENPRVENPRVENDGLQNEPYSDMTYAQTNDGNTTSAFDFDLRTSAPTAGYVFQLIGWRGYKLPYVGSNCAVMYREEPQVLVNLELRDGDLGYLGLPADRRASMVVRPGETVNWTLRAYDADKNGTFEPFCTDPVTSPGVNDCSRVMTGSVQAQAVNAGTGATTPAGDVAGPPPPSARFVINTNNNGAGSLRQAIIDANLNVGIPDAIIFAIPGDGPHTIQLAEELPNITDPVYIDGTTQPGYTNSPDITPVIEIAGSGITTGFPAGLRILTGNSVVRGLVINGFRGVGIALAGTIGGNRIEGNFIGTNVSGTAAEPNGTGVQLISPNNALGGVWPARNVISGNTLIGVSIEGAGNIVQGNFIGLDRAGLLALSVQQTYGVRIFNSPGNTIGGLDWANRNIISGNYHGVYVTGAGATGNSVRGNYIGTDKNSYIARPNVFGVYITGAASENTIGGTGATDWNVISGNSGHGLWINGQATNNIVQGNHIGAGYDGVSSVPNAVNGIAIGCAGGCYEGDEYTNGNTIGGVALGEGNTIAFNGTEGITVRSGVGNRISGNAIFSNGALGIDLIPQGTTNNDAGDADTGPNEFQNFPDLLTAVAAGGGTYVSGSLSSKPGTPGPTYRIEFFANASCDGSQSGEGARFLGSTTVATALDGGAVFAGVRLGATLPGEIYVTATATDPAGNTSEFSRCVAVESHTQFVDFETLPGGAPASYINPLANEFLAFGLGFSDLPTLYQVSMYYGGAANWALWKQVASGPLNHGFGLTFTTAPLDVTFEVTINNVSTLDIQAVDALGSPIPAGSITRQIQYYIRPGDTPPSPVPWRRETIRIQATSGVATATIIPQPGVAPIADNVRYR